MSKLESKGKIKTVLGLIENNELGFTLPHEHFLIDATIWFSEPKNLRERKLAQEQVSIKNLSWVRSHRFSNLDNWKLSDVTMAIEEALLFKEAGGNTIVDVTPQYVGRNPKALAHIAQTVGINVIMGTAYYMEASYVPEMKVDQKTVKDIANEFVRDITIGVNDTGICAGIIGEIGCSWPLTENERKVLHAAAIAQQQTGVAISIHPGFNEEAPLEIINILKEHGVDPSRVIIGHIEFAIHSNDTLSRLADTGCTLEWDRFGADGQYPNYRASDGLDKKNVDVQPDIVDVPNDTGRLNIIIQLINEGYLNQIVISHDIWTKIDTNRFGGQGYSHILNNILPLMRVKNMTEKQINAITVENPKRLLTMN